VLALNFSLEPWYFRDAKKEDLMSDQRLLFTIIVSQNADIAGAQLTAIVPKISATLWFQLL
jgi:hypothetical protein